MYACISTHIIFLIEHDNLQGLRHTGLEEERARRVADPTLGVP